MQGNSHWHAIKYEYLSEPDQYEFEKHLQLEVNKFGIPCGNVDAKVAHVFQGLQRVNVLSATTSSVLKRNTEKSKNNATDKDKKRSKKKKRL